MKRIERIEKSRVSYLSLNLETLSRKNNGEFDLQMPTPPINKTKTFRLDSIYRNSRTSKEANFLGRDLKDLTNIKLKPEQPITPITPRTNKENHFNFKKVLKLKNDNKSVDSNEKKLNTPAFRRI